MKNGQCIRCYSPNIHFTRMNLHDACARIFVGRRKLDLAVQPTRTEQSWVQNVDTIRCSDYLQSVKHELLLHRRLQVWRHREIWRKHELALMSACELNPSNWLRSSSIVRCTSRSPAFSLSKRFVPIASSSSMKMIAGAFSFARANASLTSFAPSPINIYIGG